MTDRELLELAVKAMGFPVAHNAFGMDKNHGIFSFYIDGKPWNPLTDDGDALRLAVTLRLHVSVFADAIGIGTPGRGYVETKWNGDPHAATRRAIVRAAAEIGKAME